MRWRTSGAVVSLSVSAATTLVVPSPSAASQTTDQGPPNILIIVTDDQRADTMGVMNATQDLFGEQGVQFPEGYANTPLCCPARASLLTGRFAHNHGVMKNELPIDFDHSSTIQRHLQQAGYGTAIVGKFFNRWPTASDPPYFDRWAITGDQSYTKATYNLDGAKKEVSQYSTDFLADRATTFLQSFEAEDDRPWFLHVAPIAPHLPVSPALEYESAPVDAWEWSPAVLESDLSDKPSQNRGSSPSTEVPDGVRRMLMSVDDLAAQVFAALEARGESNTLAFFTSDNGFLWYEHGLWAKNKPYTDSIKVPFFMRWPGHLGEGSIDPRPVAHVDIAATIADAAGLPPDVAGSMDGTSLLDPASRDAMLTEAWNGQMLSSWASLRSPTWQFVEYYEGDGETVWFREFYDLDEDPWQLENALVAPASPGGPDVTALHGYLRTATDCAGSSGLGACDAALVVPTVSVDDVSLPETDSGSGEAVLDVALSRPLDVTLDLAYATQDGTASASGDYLSASGTVSIPAGETTAQINLGVTGDTLAEETETFFVEISSPTGAVLLETRPSVTILNDDPDPVLALKNVSVPEGNESPTSARFPLSLSAPSGKPVTVSYDTFAESASTPGDFATVSGSLTIPPGQTEGFVDVPVTADALDEPDETFILRLNSVIGAAASVSQAVATILDDDPIPGLSIEDVAIAEGDKGGSKAVFTVTLSAPSGNAVSVDFATTQGTAQSGRDFGSTSGTLSLPPGVGSGMASVRVYGDTSVEGDETFMVTLSDPAMATISDGEAIGTILDDDTAPPPPSMPSLSVADVAVSEGHEGTVAAPFLLTLSEPAPTNVLISYQTTDGTATAGTDYHSLTGTIRIRAGRTNGIVSVPVTGDVLDEPTEKFSLTLTAASGATIADGNAVGTIVDDDEPPVVSIADASAVESDPTMTFTITLSGPSGGTVKVAYATVNGTALAGKDFKRTEGTMKIPAGETAASIQVPLLGDLLDEPDEIFFVSLSALSGTVMGDDLAAGTILDDDPVP
jgi:arylsulfatase A-like enzyme